MDHLKYLFFGIIISFILFLTAGQGTFLLLKPLILKSNFRLAVASNADNSVPISRRAYLFTGDSRVMGGINASYLAMEEKEKVFYNLAYNGLGFSDLKALLTSFERSYSGTIDTVFINAGALPRLESTNRNSSRKLSDLQMFLAAFNPKLIIHLAKVDPQLYLMSKLFPLIHFNNEFFLRSFYYSVIGKNDQNYSNNYHFKLTKAMIQRLRRTRYKANFDRQRLSEFKDGLSRQGIKLVVIIPPFHPGYVKYVLGFNEGIKELELLAQDLRIKFYNHSKLFMRNENYFADPKHINKLGQKFYTKYILENIILKASNYRYNKTTYIEQM